MVADLLDTRTLGFYRDVMHLLTEAGERFLVGGAYAMAAYAGIVRHTKDFDIFVHPDESERILRRLAAAGYPTERTHPHWLAKAFGPDAFVDVIYSSGNGIVPVDEGWFAHAIEGSVLGESVRLCPVEEMIWSKAFILEHDRCDVADVMHLLRVRGPELDWPRLIARFGTHWQLLLSHLMLFSYVYLSERECIPRPVLGALLRRAEDELTGNAPTTSEPLCQGTLVSWSQYLPDIEQWGYLDARLPPWGAMSDEDVAHWTAAEK